MGVGTERDRERGEWIVVVVVVYLTLSDPLRIQPWSQDRRNQTKSNRKSEISKESRPKRTDNKIASKDASEKRQNGNGDGSGDGVGTGTETRAGVETRGRTQYRNEDGSGDENKISNGYRNRSGNMDGDRNEDMIWEGGGEAKKRVKPHKGCKRDVGNGEDLGGEKKKRRQERVGSVNAYPSNPDNSKEVCVCRECVSSLPQRFPRLI